MTAALPAGTITFLFTDIEGSTRLWEQYPEGMQAALSRHDDILRLAIEAHRGQVVKTTGDGLMAVFTQPAEAVAAMLDAQRALAGENWSGTGALRVRMGLHSGSAQAREGDYYGSTVNRAARLMAVAHGGQMLVSDAAAHLLRDNMPPQVELRDLGEHGLRDLARPEHIYQVISPGLPADFPALLSPGSFPNNLPAQLTSFVGRAREIGEVKRLLGGAHLVTLIGPGGTGKTRLSLQVAAQMLEQFADGAWLVEFAPLSDPALVPQTVSTTLGLSEQPGRPLMAQLADYLRPKKLLLVLDNCEHLIEACAQLADELLRACASLRVMASSREALGIAGESSYPVPPLQTPELQGELTPVRLAAFESVRLFVERAHSVQPRFSLTEANAQAVAQICIRLDGIPLAIELAAARIQLFTPRQIAARLDDRFHLLTGGSRTALPRQQTLHALIEWSYDLLSPAECALMRRLSVFAGGWTFEAAEYVCAPAGAPGAPEESPSAPLDVLEGLTQLVHKSLVVVEDRGDETRYDYLETIRQFAQEKLLASGEARQAHGRHLEHYLALARRAEPLLHSREQAAWLERLEVETGNFRAAMDWAMANSETAKALDLAGALWWFWYARDHLAEARERMTSVLARAAPGEPGEAHLRVMTGLGFIHYTAGDLPAARALLERAVSLSRQLGSRRGLAQSLQFLGAVEFVDAARSSPGDFTSVRRIEEESLALWLALDDKTGISWARNLLASVAQAEGDLVRARALWEDSVALRREVGDRVLLAYSLRRLGEMALLQRDYEAAESAFREGLYLLMEIKGRATIAASLAGLAGLALARGQLMRAVRLCGAVHAILESLAWRLPPADDEPYQRNVASARAQLGAEQFSAAWDEGRAMSTEQAIAYALAK